MPDETILIVEDSAVNRKLVETILQPHGYHLLIAENGKDAIEIAIREQPDLVLMDMKLPEIDGYEATQTLKSKSETKQIPIVALTAQAMDREREHALEVGCVGHIAKPIDTRAFPDQIRTYLDTPEEAVGG